MTISGHKIKFIVFDECDDLLGDYATMVVAHKMDDIIIIDECSRIDPTLFDDIILSESHILRPDLPKLTIPKIHTEDLSHDPKQSAWARHNQAPRSVRKRR